MIEDAYRLGEGMGLSVWCADQAGPFQTVPHPGPSWRPEGEPARQPHEYLRDGTAKVLTLFHPKDGQVRLAGVTSCTNAVLHPWLRGELTSVLEAIPAPAGEPAAAARVAWERWQDGLTVKPTLLSELPPLRMLLVLDNLAGHKTAAFVCWLFAHGIMPLDTPISGSWLNMAESLQRILKRRALGGQHPERTGQIIGWFERHPEYHLHFTPTSGSWLNQVERFFAEITEKQIRRGVFRRVAALEKAIMEYLAVHNEDPKPFVWTANADLILERVKKVCERTSNSGH